MKNFVNAFRMGLGLAGLCLLTACAGNAPLFEKSPGPVVVADAPPAIDPTMTAPPPPVGARTAEALDTTTPEQRAAALAAPQPAGERELGRVAVSLGNPTEPGFWLRSSLVSAPVEGRVETASGKSVQVDLRPGAGAAQLSLAGFQALGLSLTDLPEVSVFGP
jgi:hypothetical protein